MKKTIFSIPKMDCPSEERMIRMAFDGKDRIKSLKFDLGDRTLTVVHSDAPEEVLSLLTPLGLGASIFNSKAAEESDVILSSDNKLKDEAELSVLKKVFLINAFMFLIEIVLGIIAQSTGLISDSLDMFADAAVYGLSIYAVGKTITLKKRAARMSGYFQLILAFFALSEVIRRFLFGSEPSSDLMIGIGALALIANVSCMALLYRHKDGEVHLKASWIFSTNDVIANIGVIIAGILVSITSSHWPDLIVGSIIAVIVFSGALRILKSAR